MYERFTDRCRKVMRLATNKAKERGDCYLGVHHLFLALLEDGSGLAANVLKRLEINFASVYEQVASSEPVCGSIDFIGCFPYTPNTKKALDHANEVATCLGHNYIGTEHLLLGLLKTSHPVVTDVFSKHGVDYDKVYEAVLDLLSYENKTPSKEEIAINFYQGVLKRIMKVCEENSNDNGVQEIRKIVHRAMLDGGKWNIS